MTRHLTLLLGIAIMSIFLTQSMGAQALASAPLMSQMSVAERTNVQHVQEIVNYVQSNLCSMADNDILRTGVTKDDLRKARDFCKKTRIEMMEFFSQAMITLPAGAQAAYSCGGKTGIPNYANLGLTSSSCVWHDPNPICKVEKGVACLWGCNNSDPSLGWHIKNFASKTKLETEIISKGYHLVPGQFGGSYRRGLQYGYSYQVHQISGNYSTGAGNWHSEGPEPDAEPNWPGILGGWYPGNTEQWHIAC